MQVQVKCRRCQAPMTVLDLFMEGCDLVCLRCGIHEIIRPELEKAPVCYQ